MNIILITPAPRRSRAGNRTTAERWARQLRDLGHRVAVAVDYSDGDYDAMIALHAWRSAEAIERFRQRHSARPLIVALTGTDIYRFLHTHPETTERSMRLADRLVALHEAVFNDLPADHHPKIQVIFQSAQPLLRRVAPSVRYFDVCVVGHLREEKDPLRTAWAARELPASSKIRVHHYGSAHTKEWAEQARREMQENPRYHWLGEVPHWQVRRAYAKSRLMVLSSRMEGGANVISEAVVAGLPVIASNISGSIGLLGRDYPGYYPVEDTAALRQVLERAEREPAFLEVLRERCAERAPLFQPEAEREAWRMLLDGLGG